MAETPPQPRRLWRAVAAHVRQTGGRTYPLPYRVDACPILSLIKHARSARPHERWARPMPIDAGPAGRPHAGAAAFTMLRRAVTARTTTAGRRRKRRGAAACIWRDGERGKDEVRLAPFRAVCLRAKKKRRRSPPHLSPSCRPSARPRTRPSSRPSWPRNRQPKPPRRQVRKGREEMGERVWRRQTDTRHGPPHSHHPQPPLSLSPRRRRRPRRARRPLLRTPSLPRPGV